MSLLQECEALRRIPMFAKIDPARLKLLSFTSERVSFAPGEAFIRQGDIGDSAYVILEGEAQVLIDGDQEEIILGVIGANRMVGDVALLHQGRRTATVRALTPLACLKLSRDVFYHLLQESPDFALTILRDLATRLDRSTQQVQQAVNGRRITTGRDTARQSA